MLYQAELRPDIGQGLPVSLRKVKAAELRNAGSGPLRLFSRVEGRVTHEVTGLDAQASGRATSQFQDC